MEEPFIDQAYALVEEDTHKTNSPAMRIGWGLFLLLIVFAFLISLGVQMGVLFFTVGVLMIVLAWRFPYETFYLVALSSLLLGLTVALPLGDIPFGIRAFGGTVDMLVFEAMAGALLVAWSLRMLTLWRGRRDRNWRPWLPLILPYMGLVIAHALSVFSPTGPDPIGVIKFSLRPVFAVYLISIALTVNFVRSEKRLRVLLAVISMTCLFFALDGFRSVFIGGLEVSFDRARPLFQLFGLNPLGGNHNALAQMMLIGMPTALALGSLIKFQAEKRLLYYAALFMGFISLLTLARSAWIAFASMLVFLGLTTWRGFFKAHIGKTLAAFVLLIPLAFYMISFSLSDEVQGSTDARTLLTQIAFDAFRESPLVGIGAGTFTNRVGSTYAYIVEFNVPRDSHGVMQKLVAETGALGTMAFIAVMASMILVIRKDWKVIRAQKVRLETYSYFIAGALGAFVYQLFDTTYWTARLWLPVALVLAAGHIFKRVHDARDPDFLSPRNV
jgi:O-antigen ligase